MLKTRWVRLAALALLAPFRVFAHDAPNDVTVRAFLKPEGQTLRLLVRTPMAAMQDVVLPERGRGYLDFENAGPLLPPAVPFYSVGMYEQTFPFYLQRTLTLVDYRDEMGFGLDREPSLGIADRAEFVTRWQSAPDAFAIMNPGTYRELQAAQLPMQVVARDTRRIVVRRAGAGS